MSTDKIKKLESLVDEVNDFQPVLSELFKRLPDVTSVECKQGPNEKGADFVLIKNDSTLDEETYIGVICKVGKITQNHSEVERQISECLLYPRLVSSGKKNIMLNEIWVVTNSTISANAEEKIYLNNKNTNIRFLNAQKVIGLIDKFYSEYWDFVSLKYGSYFTDIELQIATGRESTFFGTIESSVAISRQVINESKRKNKIIYEDITGVVDKEKFIFLEGHVGSGKSTLVKQLVLDAKKNIEENESNGYLPVIYQYSDVHHKASDIINIVNTTLKKFKIPMDRNILIIIDGLDEVKDSLAERIENLKLMISQVNNLNNAKLLVTARTMDSLHDYDVIDTLFTRYSIVPLSIKQIINLVDKMCSNEVISRKLLVGIEKTPLFKFIPRTPISAILLARILSDEVKELPSTMTELYAKYTEVVLGRWDASKGLISQTEYEIMHNVLMSISKYMMENSLNCISQSEVQDVYLNYLEKRNIEVDIDRLFNRILNRSEVASINNKNNTFSFVHRSFMEYFYAESLRRDGDVVLDQNIYSLYWTNSFFFYLGLVRDSEKYIEQINAIAPTQDEYRFIRLFTNGSLYLAAYLTPYEVIQKGVMSTYIEAGKLYNDIVNGNDIGQLKQLPPIALLCIFTKSFYNNFSYDFFEKALKNASAEIMKTLNPSESEKYSVFFLSATLNELGDKKAFDALIEKWDVDILIQLGITHVSNESRNVSDSVDRYMKKLKKRYKGNPAMGEYIYNLHDLSVSELEEKKKKSN